MTIRNDGDTTKGWRKKSGPPSHCKYSEIPWPNCVEIGELLQYYMLNTVINFFHRAVAPPSENTATVVYSHCTNRFEHHTVAVFLLGGATARWNFKQKVNDCVQHIILQKFTNFHAILSWNFQNICNEIGWPRFLHHPVESVASEWPESAMQSGDGEWRIVNPPCFPNKLPYTCTV